jgi:hypothetical protein
VQCHLAASLEPAGPLRSAHAAVRAAGLWLRQDQHSPAAAAAAAHLDAVLQGTAEGQQAAAAAPADTGGCNGPSFWI